MKKNSLFVTLFLISSVIVLITAVITGVMVKNSTTMIIESTKGRLVDLACMAALVFNADEMEDFAAPSDMEKPEYEVLIQKLIHFTNEADIIYTYILYLDETTNMMQFIADNDESEEAVNLATPQVEREPAPDLALKGTANAADYGEYSTGWEGLLTAYAPLYYENGAPSNYIVGVDMQDIYIQTANRNFKIITILFISSATLVLASGAASLYLYHRKALQYEQASNSKSLFLSNMSHEMRTPLNAIIGMSDIAEETPDNERIMYCLDKIRDASRHLLGVINDILDISKIESGKFTISNSDFVFDLLLNSVNNVMNYKINEKRIGYAIDIAPDVPYSIVSDKQRLGQVITNLLSNAVKFTPEGGQIELSVSKLEERDGNCVLKIEVKDTGIGIEPEKQAALFQSFEQADNSISRRFGGTGLGLAISKSIVEMMGGRIWVESTPGVGSDFMFTVAVGLGKSEKMTLSPNVRWKELQLLVVDDEPETLTFMERLAAATGLKCLTARNGDEALRLVAERKPAFDFVFIDQSIPDKPGIELAAEIAENDPACRIVMLANVAEWENIRHRAAALGIGHFVSKPLLTSNIVNCIEELLRDGKNPPADETSKESATDGIFSNRTILLVEDIEINREIVIDLLLGTGVTIDSACDGQQAFDMFDRAPDRYDLILMDIHMPKVDGYRATEMIRTSEHERGRNIPIIAMTANVFREDVERCIAAGMNDHIGKPIAIGEVIEKMKRYLMGSGN